MIINEFSQSFEIHQDEIEQDGPIESKEYKQV